MKKKSKGATKTEERKRPEIDISHTPPTHYDPIPTWPYTAPDPRPFPYGKPGKRVRVLILPAKVEYDPGMNAIEQAVRAAMEKDLHVTIVVPDVYRGVGEIMARRNGLNLLVVNTDERGATSLPSLYSIGKLEKSKIARRRVLMETDVILAMKNAPLLDVFKADAEDKFPDIKIRGFKPLYVKRAKPEVAKMLPVPKAKPPAYAAAEKKKKEPEFKPALMKKKKPAVEDQKETYRAPYC